MLKSILKQKHVHLVNRGNTAILLSFLIARKFNDKRYVLVQDQGGWLSYEKLAKKAGLEVKSIKTENGVINEITDEDLKDVACLIYTQPAGYCLKQDSEIIFNRVKSLESDVIIITDCSGSIGSKICKSEHSDILVGSFSKWKPVNLGEGGFISFNDSRFEEVVNREIDENNDYLFKGSLHTLIAKLDRIDERYDLFHKHCEKIKSDLKGYELLWNSGIVVIAKFKNKEEKEFLIDYCNKNGYEYTECPREIRVKEDAISIEVKRL
ncbi:hypothetical protein KY330_03740 [Candidatus Woesearchaeota archaeon]|nr:hypothetical protein [Candidatus Woesearchaeota archaeon]